MKKPTDISKKPSTKNADVTKLEEEVVQAQDQVKRAVADYQNLVRRTREDRVKMAKFANKQLIEDLIQPLDHLTLATKQIDDAGLSMVVSQLWEALEQHGLEKVNPVDQAFDVTTMEAVETKGSGNTVSEVQSPGYTLHGDIIKHAKVVVQ